ncbi:MAG: hypothetical protein H6747_01495 [Deltaproteobacteria bacterium]|nr:hypothetical protein [Deltaproteobacteria bacterium]
MKRHSPRSGRHLARLLPLLLAGLLGCIRPLPLDAPQLDVAGRAAAARQRQSRERGAANLELAWLCLLHGHGCERLPDYAVAAVETAPDMALAQLTRAIGLQGTADVRARAAAWLDLALWAATAEQDAQTGPGAAAAPLAPFALRMALRLRHLDPVAVRDALADAPHALDAGLHRADATERHAVAVALRGLLPRAVWPPALDDTVGAQARVAVHQTPLHKRPYSGLGALRQGPQDLDPAGWIALPQRFGRRFALPPAPASVRALRLTLPAHPTARTLLVASPRPLQISDASGHFGPPLPAGSHAIALPAAATQTRYIAVSATGELDAVEVAVLRPDPPRAATAPAPAKTWQDRALRRVLAMAVVAERDPAAANRWRGHGALPALLGLLRHDRPSAAPESLLDRVLDHRDDHVDARIGRAARAREEGQGALGRALLAPLAIALERGERHDGVLAGRLDLLLELGWQDLAEGLGDHAVARAEQAVARQPGDCGALAGALELATLTLERAAIRRLLAQAPACPGLGLRLADAALAVGDLEQAERRLLALVRRPATAKVAGERLAVVQRTLGRLRPHQTPRDARWRQVQQLRLAGEEAAAARALNHLLLDPGIDDEQRRRALQLGATRPWRGLQVDGLAHVAAHREVEAAGAGMVWLLDQEIVVLLPGGGAIRRLHQIVRVERAEVADQLGEVQVPVDAEVELVRTILPDGQTLGPADTPDKETVSLRGVVPGACVEQITVQVVAADDPATGTTRLPTFLFGSFDGPAVRSEVVVLAPPELQPQLERGAQTPEPERGSHPAREGAPPWRLLRVVVRDQPRLRNEPRANRPDRVFATLRVSAGAADEETAGQVEERLAAHLERRDPALEPWLAEARAAKQDPARWQTLVAKLFRRIEDGGSAGQPGPPDGTARERKGDRAALLWHLAHRSGVQACLLRVAPWSREKVGTPLDLTDFGLAAVELRFTSPGVGGERVVVYDAGVDGGLPDVLRPGLRRRPALRFGCAAGRAERRFATANLGAESDRREVVARMRWTAEGEVEVDGEDVLHGVLAVIVRNLLVSGDDETRAAVLQQLTSASFPGMTASWRDAPGAPAYSGLGSDLEPIRLRWRVRAPADDFRRRALRLGVVPYRLGRMYATLAERKLPLRVGHTLDVVVRLEVDAGGPLRPVAPAVVEAVAGAPHLSLQRTVQPGPAGVVVEQRLRVEMGVVAPQAYPGWAERLRQIDDAERLRLERAEPALPPRG